MLQHVWERACRARRLSEVIVATDDERIYAAARGFGARVEMTRSDHSSGTDRAAEVAERIAAEWVVNIQGDEPLIDPEAIDAAVEGLLKRPETPMGTLRKRIEDESELNNPNVVKVVTDRNGFALYFSRWPIPFAREGCCERYKHIGLYVYRSEFLKMYPSLPRGVLEEAEKLEQLRALENGYKIFVVDTDYESCGVDTPEDLARVSAMLDRAPLRGRAK